MAESLWHTAFGSFGTFGSNATRNANLFSGEAMASGSETQAETTHRTAGTLSKLYVLITANSLNSGSSTIYVRKNRANGSQFVSFDFATTGEFRDDSNTDSVSAADETGYRIITSGTSGSVTIRSISILFAATTNTVTRIGSVNYVALAASGTQYRGFGDFRSSGTSTVEAYAQSKFRCGGTLKNAFAYVNANTVSAASNVKSRINGADGNSNISITASTTGIFEDTSNTDTIAAGDLVCSVLLPGASGTSITLYHSCYEFETTTGKSQLASTLTSGRAIASLTAYAPIASALSANTTESFYRTEARVACTASDLEVYVSANTATATTADLRLNGASSALTIAVGSSATGWHEDVTHTVSIAATDEINYRIASTGGTCTITNISMVLEVSAAATQTFNAAAAAVSINSKTTTFAPGAVTFSAAAAAITINDQAGTFAPGAVTFSAAAGAVVLNSQAPTFAPGAVTFSAASAAVALNNQAGNFISRSLPSGAPPLVLTTKFTDLIPESDRGSPQWSRVGTGLAGNYDAINDYATSNTGDGSSTYILHSASGGVDAKIDIYNMNDMPVSLTSTTRLPNRVYLYSLSGWLLQGDSNEIQLGVQNPATSTIYYGTATTHSAFADPTVFDMPTRPWDGQQWTWDDVNALRVVVRSVIDGTINPGENAVTMLYGLIYHDDTRTFYADNAEITLSPKVVSLGGISQTMTVAASAVTLTPRAPIFMQSAGAIEPLEARLRGDFVVTDDNPAFLLAFDAEFVTANNNPNFKTEEQP